MPEELLYREGRQEDSLRLAQMITDAAGGAVDYLVHDVIPGLTPAQIIAQNLADDAEPFTYRNAIVAECGLQIVGMALSYPSHFHRITEEMRRFFPKDRLDHFASFYAARVEDSLFLDALYVNEQYRGKGIGRGLIARTAQKAQQKGYDMVSLMLFADNTDALRLYKQCGFKVVQQVELKWHELMPHHGGCLLMKCDLTG